MRRDMLGVEIEIGDLVVSTASGRYGKHKIGRVEKIFDHGRITMKYAKKVNVYAYERGAPQIERSGTRPKVDENGNYVTVDDPRGIKDWRGKVWQVNVREEYTRMVDDTTVVGTRWTWVKEQASDDHILVLAKSGGRPNVELSKVVGLDYNKEIPEWAG